MASPSTDVVILSAGNLAGLRLSTWLMMLGKAEGTWSVLNPSQAGPPKMAVGQVKKELPAIHHRQVTTIDRKIPWTVGGRPSMG
ncbi:MAG: hypothetical protein M1358_05855 [Chloroflexi bacterium]|nr:hypothetical protein [Chloroflexota bacterium]